MSNLIWFLTTFVLGYYFYPTLKIIRIYRVAKKLEKTLNTIHQEEKEIRELLEQTLKDWKEGK